MEKTYRSDLKYSKSNYQKAFFQIGDKTVCIINKAIAEKLCITEDDYCEQSISEDGSIIFSIKKDGT